MGPVAGLFDGLALVGWPGSVPVTITYADGEILGYDISGADLRSELAKAAGASPAFLRSIADAAVEVDFSPEPERRLRTPKRRELTRSVDSGCARSEGV